MRFRLWLVLMFVALGASASEDDQRFTELVDRYVDEFPALSPVSATFLGDHRFDGELDRLTDESRRQQGQFYRRYLEDLRAIDRSKLSRANQVDALLLENKLAESLWHLEVFQEWAWNPTRYTALAGGALYGLLARDYAPLEERLIHVTERLEQFPRLFEEIRASLDPQRVPKIHVETAIQQNRGVFSILRSSVIPHLDVLSDEERLRLELTMGIAQSVVEEHQEWLEQTLLPAAQGDFRIGAERFDAKLEFTLQSKMDRTTIRRRAEQQIATVRESMLAVARDILGEAYPAASQQETIQAALEVVYRDRPERGGIVDTAKAALKEATEFVRARNIVTVPADPVEIIIMPEFRRGVSLAYCDSPGALDKGQMTFYALSPLPENWTAEQDESFLREYNDMSIQVLSIHEAVPGHYLQIAHANAYPSTLRAVLSSGPFIEGWAVYAESVMQEEGYLDHDPRFALMVLKWFLRDAANAIIDQAIHTEGMTRDEAMDLMVTQAFQEEREAAGKWVRAQLTSAQLSTYFVGYLEHADLRAESEKAWRDAFELKAYHDKVLSFGAPPVHYLRALILDLPIEPPTVR
jgi:uncharacterized protein (DUF885 family)